MDESGYPTLISKETSSLLAINELRDDYPYAASLLVYTVLERCLKIYLMENRNNEEMRRRIDLEIRVKGSRLSEQLQKHLDDEQFVNDVLMHCTLRKLEKIYKIGQCFSTHRNHIVHSNLYLSEQRSDSDDMRMQKNKGYLENAIRDLIRASRYFGKEIIEVGGGLKFV